jgi:hypothetical protein
LPSSTETSIINQPGTQFFFRSDVAGAGSIIAVVLKLQQGNSSNSATYMARRTAETSTKQSSSSFGCVSKYHTIRAIHKSFPRALERRQLKHKHQMTWLVFLPWLRRCSRSRGRLIQAVDRLLLLLFMHSF